MIRLISVDIIQRTTKQLTSGKITLRHLCPIVCSSSLTSFDGHNAWQEICRLCVLHQMLRREGNHGSKMKEQKNRF